jgi:hypothetical protein
MRIAAATQATRSSSPRPGRGGYQYAHDYRSRSHGAQPNGTLVSSHTFPLHTSACSHRAAGPQ